MTNTKRHPDYPLLGVICVLVVLGVVILASVSLAVSHERFGNTYHYLNHQLLYGLLPGLILAFFVFFKVKLASLKKWAPFLLLVNLIFMAMVFLPKIGSSLGGASRWISLGPLSFQPSEFLKITFILYLASWLSSRGSCERKRGLHGVGKLDSAKNEKFFSQTFITFLIVVGIISLFFILQPDISTLGVIILIAIVMYFLGGNSVWHIALMVFTGICGLIALVKIAPYRINRLLVYLHPETDPMGIGYQIKQSLIVVGSGGLFGQGLGMSQQKFGFLPQSISDSVFVIFAKEAGFIGGIVLICVFLFFFCRSFMVARQISDKFLQLVVYGIGFWITLQAFINIGAMIGILPLSGVPLPFISCGGSALISELTAMGILLKISKEAH